MAVGPRYGLLGLRGAPEKLFFGNGVATRTAERTVKGRNQSNPNVCLCWLAAGFGKYLQLRSGLQQSRHAVTITTERTPQVYNTKQLVEGLR